MAKKTFPLSDYGFAEQSYVYTLCEERRDWRIFIEKHITESKEEIMGKDEDGALVSISKAENDIKEHVTNAKEEIKEHVDNAKISVITEVNTSKDDVKAHITQSENNINQHTTQKTSTILSAINDLKTWWSTFRPNWA